MRVHFSRRKAPKPRLRQLAPIAVPSMTDADMAAIYHGERIGGDFCDFLRVSPHRVLFSLLDVAGRHDENMGIVRAAQKTFRAQGAKLFAGDDLNEATAMIEFSVELNRAILEAAGGVRSCPAFVASYNERLGTVCYSNAGHTPALLRDRSAITQLPATGLPLGLFSHVTYDAFTVALESGAALLLVSRGVTEGRCQEEEFGLERVRASLHTAVVKTAEQLCTHILDSVEQFMCVPPTHNDVTALALVRPAAAKSTIAK